MMKLIGRLCLSVAMTGLAVGLIFEAPRLVRDANRGIETPATVVRMDRTSSADSTPAIVACVVAGVAAGVLASHPYGARRR
jgi:hypothetical protein